jgi:hypothetical protein
MISLPLRSLSPSHAWLAPPHRSPSWSLSPALNFSCWTIARSGGLRNSRVAPGPPLQPPLSGWKRQSTPLIERQAEALLLCRCESVKSCETAQALLYYLQGEARLAHQGCHPHTHFALVSLRRPGDHHCTPRKSHRCIVQSTSLSLCFPRRAILSRQSIHSRHPRPVHCQTAALRHPPNPCFSSTLR